MILPGLDCCLTVSAACNGECSRAVVSGNDLTVAGVLSVDPLGEGLASW